MPNTTNEIETLKELYAALNRGDIPAMLALFDAEAERTEFEGTPMGGTYRGLDSIEAHIRAGRGTWAEGGCHPEAFTASGDKIVVDVAVRVRLKEGDIWAEGRVADAYAFRDGKIVRWISFLEREKAVAWAGLAKAAFDA